eukprot:4936370-Lingulodinium_polyedra.AAC.1
MYYSTPPFGVGKAAVNYPRSRSRAPGGGIWPSLARWALNYKGTSCQVMIEPPRGFVAGGRGTQSIRCTWQ